MNTKLLSRSHEVILICEDIERRINQVAKNVFLYPTKRLHPVENINNGAEVQEDKEHER